MKIVFLGTGTSHGIPVIGCKCAVCNSSDLRNRRTRSSVYLEIDGVNLLLDAATELRLQAVREGIERVDAILITHTHADHVFGLDDVRRFNDLQHAEIPCYGSSQTVSDLHRVFEYAFRETQPGGGKPQLRLIAVDEDFSVSGLVVTPIPVMHGNIEIFGFRIQNFAYVTDCNFISQESMGKLKSLDVLVLDALRYRRHPTHFNLEEALEVVDALKPGRTYFTHLCHDLDHEAVQDKLPEGVYLAYDGLKIEAK